MSRRIFVAVALFVILSSSVFAQPDDDAVKQQAKDTRAAAETSLIAGIGVCGIVSIIAGCVASLIMYFVPVFVAMARRHPDLPSIIIVNMAFGVTCIGWWIALIWAFKAIPSNYDR